MQAETATEWAGCTCRLERVEPMGFKRVGEHCGYCMAWMVMLETGSSELLKKYPIRFKRETGQPETDSRDSIG